MAWLAFNSTYQSMFLVREKPKNTGFYEVYVILRTVEPLKKHVQKILANRNTINAWQQLTSLLTIPPASKIPTYCCPGWREEGGSQSQAGSGLCPPSQDAHQTFFFYFYLSSVLIILPWKLVNVICLDIDIGSFYTLVVPPPHGPGVAAANSPCNWQMVHNSKVFRVPKSKPTIV